MLPPSEAAPFTHDSPPSPPSHKKSWFTGFFAHWHPISKRTMTTDTATTQLSTATSLTMSRNTMLGPPPMPSSSSSSSSTSSSSTSTTHHPTTITIQLAPPQRPSDDTTSTRRTTSLFSERRQSQQTIGSVLSDNSGGRDSEERSRLGDLWSRARKRHPHYPRFHWPRTSPINILHHHHRQSSSSNTQEEDRIRPLANSYQDTQRPVLSSPPASMMHKRHSITSFISNTTSHNNNLTSNDPYFLSATADGSRPHSVIAPDSPHILFIKDGQLWDNDEEWMNDGYCLEKDDNNNEDDDANNNALTYRWTLKHDLLKLALNGLMGCPVEENEGDKQVLQIGCGDGTWCANVAAANPKWMVIGMEDTTYNTLSSSTTHRSLFFTPKNMRLIRCAPSLLHALQQMPDHVFDLVEGRCLILTYGLDMYRQLVKECWRVCKPGGYVELVEMDMRMYHSKPSVLATTVHTLNSKVIHKMEAQALDPRLARRLPDLLDEVISTDAMPSRTVAGYTSLPIGVWGGRLGVMFREDVHRLMETWLDEPPFEHTLDQMDAEMETHRSFMNLHHCYAQKSV